MRAPATPTLWFSGGKGVEVCDDCISITADIRTDSVARALFEPSRLRATCPAKYIMMTYKYIISWVYIDLYSYSVRCIIRDVHCFVIVAKYDVQYDCDENVARIILHGLSTVLEKNPKIRNEHSTRRNAFWTRGYMITFLSFLRNLTTRLVYLFSILQYIPHSLRKNSLRNDFQACADRPTGKPGVSRWASTIYLAFGQCNVFFIISRNNSLI